MRNRRAALVLLVVGVVLIGVSVALMRGNTPAPTDAGALPPMSITSATVPAGPPTGTVSSGSTSAARPIPGTTGAVVTPPSTAAPDLTSASASASASRSASTSRSAAAATPTAPAAGRPMVLHLPTLDVTARVEPVDSTDGVLQVPEDISRVGWWQHSAAAGATTGSTVLDGHIDSAVTGEGALFHLADLAPGDPLSVTTSAGTTIRYQVQARRVYVKEQGLPADLFSQQGPGRLVIISCGGTFDRTLRSYEENIAVFAIPVG